MLVGSDVQTMKIQDAVTVDTREVLDGEPLDARGKGSRIAGINDSNAVLALTSPNIEMISAAVISFRIFDVRLDLLTRGASVGGKCCLSKPCRDIQSFHATTCLRILPSRACLSSRNEHGCMHESTQLYD